MKKSSLLLLLLCSLAFLLESHTANAAPATFKVDLANLDGWGSGAVLRVFGTITLDPDIEDTTIAITSSSFYHQRNDDAPIAFLEYSNTAGADWDFFVKGNQLFVAWSADKARRVAISWSNPEEEFFLALIARNFTRPSLIFEDHTGVIDGPISNLRSWWISLTEGPIQLGVKVPEPSTASLIGLAVAVPVLQCRRSRITSCP